ncbi:MAG: amidase family protein, partial [Planctomycetota bacterium]
TGRTSAMAKPSSRRSFLKSAGVATAAGALPATAGAEQSEESEEPDQAEITPATIAEAEKLAAVVFTDAEREAIHKGIGEQVARYVGRRAQALPNGLAPATIFDPRMTDTRVHASQRPIVRSEGDPGPLPARETDIAFAPVTALARWIERQELTSTRLTRIYLDRLRSFGPKLECVVTLTERLAMAQAERADREIAAGRYRGPLHGIPWGAKDLLDTAGIVTTWGATPYKDRVAEGDAAVVRRLEEAGAVLVAKLTLGALAYGDIWFDGRTNSPWNLEQGSRGSSAGSAAATAAGLVGFSLGTETLGSIVSPCMRCGTTGLRPTFGRVARTGAMALCWSLDKIGPNGADPGDPSSLDVPFNFDASQSLSRLRLGYDPAWFEDRRATDLDRNALAVARGLGLKLVEISLPDWPYGALMTILLVEAAAAFEELTLSNRDDELVWQAPEAWPNTFRTTRFAPAIEYVQAQRFRRRVMAMMAERFADIDAIISPSFASSLLLITNSTGHPSLTIRCGLRANGTPRGITLWGRLFEEGTLCRIGMALESALDVWDKRPPL